MTDNLIIAKSISDINNWLPSYLNLPYKHLGNSREGIDCFNLCRLVLEEQLGYNIPYTTQDSGCDVDVDWYSKTKTANILFDRANPVWGWDVVQEPQSFDVILLSIGSTNAPNHCALLLGKQLLQISEGKTSFMSPYGRYYKQYTVRVGRWNNNLKNY